MTPYLILAIFPTVAWLFKDRVRLNIGHRSLYKTKSLSIDIFMIVLLCLLAFRGLQCGNDTIQYFRLFKMYSASSLSDLFAGQTHEMGYKLFNKLIGLLTDNYQCLLITTALTCVCPLWYFYKKESEIPLLTIALFLSVSPFVMFFSGIRQAIAMSMGVFAWYTAKNKKLVLFFTVVLIAIQFHSSAFILILLYPIYHAKITKKWLWFVIPCMAIVYFFKDLIFAFLIEQLWKDYQITEETGAIMVLLLLILFAIYSYVMVEEESLDQDTIALRNVLLLSVVIQIFAMLHPLSMRMNYYFLIFIPILIPKIANRCKKQYVMLSKISIAVMTIYFLYYFVNMMITDNDPLNIFPYIPFWENP